MHYKQVRNHGRVLKSTLKTFNEVIDKGGYYELILTDVKMNETGRAKIDKEDLEKAKSVGRWHLHSKDGYVCNREACISLHRLVTNAKEEDYVDHVKSGIKFRSDNRKKNLRICTQSQNLFNQVRKPGISGYVGVSWSESSKKWAARIVVKGETIRLGLFISAKEASKAYIKAARKYHGIYFNKSRDS